MASVPIALAVSLPQVGLCLRRHRRLQVFVNLVEEALRRKPLLLIADEESEILRHEAGLDRIDTDFLQRRRELQQLPGWQEEIGQYRLLEACIRVSRQPRRVDAHLPSRM